MKEAETAPAANRQAIQSWVAVALLLATATALGFLMEQHESLTGQAMVYVLAVVIASCTLRWQESVVGAVLAVFAFNFFFVPPRWTLEIESREQLITLYTMLSVALVISRLASGLRRETETSRLNGHRARQLQVLATALSGANTAHDILALGQPLWNPQ